jgi:RNA polymerase sigma-70 factor (sigma-E family)
MEQWLEGEAGVVERPIPGRDEAMLGLFDEHYLPLCRLAFVILGNHALAEEIVMEALLKTFSGWGRLRDPSRADVYLRRAVINLARSKIRRRMLERRTNESMAHEPAPAPVDLDAHETTTVVWAAVRELPERQRSCVVLRYYEDLPVAQIAEILDCSVGTVKSQLSKARAKLNLSLGDEGVGGEAS